ncbi:MAG: glycoside hydrolase family 3 protein [Gammaproteobacteria bacterium]|nr:glycoside hydrolase family 3 protein [Gammaproteobacteria bacterium]
MALAAAAMPAVASPPAPAVHPDQWPTVQPALAPDPTLESRLNVMIAAMTLEQKVGQVIQPDIASITPEDLRHYDLGSILNGGNSSPNGDEFAPPSEWLALADRFYDASTDVAHGAHPIPTMWGTDAVHGHNNIVGATIFPHNIGLGAARDPNLMRKIGEITAREVRITGLDWSFGPTLAVVRDIRWGRSYESYSEDPEIVRQYGTAMMLGLQGPPGTAQFLDASHVIASPKHFVGDGGTEGKDQGDNLSSEAELRDVHAAGYPAALAAGAQTVMASFSSWHGVRMSANEPLLTEVLKGRMGFDGFVVGDWNSHASVQGCTKFNCPAAINAGLDVFMAPDSWKELYANTLREARSGEIPEARLNDAVRRVLRVKLRAHLLDEGRPSSRPLAGHFELLGSPEHRAVARQAVRESLVLLKNAHHLLPLSPHAHVLVAGDGADNIGKQSGGWTITWQGTGVSNKDFPNGESIYSGIRRAVVAAGGSAELSVSGEFHARPDAGRAKAPPPDVAIVVFGENPYAEFQGDLASAEYSPGAKPDLELLRKLRGSGVPVVAVFLSGRPLWVNPEINASDAFVAAWLPGSEGGGVADVLFKAPGGTVRYDFHGKLSFAWPRTTQQTAAVLPAGDSPLFPYNFGLSYHDSGDLKKLPEDAGAESATAIDTHVFFAAGRARAGWRWVGAEGVSTAPAAGAGPDIHEFPRGAGALADGRLIMTAADKSAQEDARLLSWSGAGPASVGLTGTSAIDLQREANGQLSLAFDYKASYPLTANMTLRMDCGADCRGGVPITREVAATAPGQWGHLKVPLACFARAGADMSHVTTPFALETSGKLALTIANIHLESGTDGVASCADGPAFK